MSGNSLFLAIIHWALQPHCSHVDKGGVRKHADGRNPISTHMQSPANCTYTCDMRIRQPHCRQNTHYSYTGSAIPFSISSQLQPFGLNYTCIRQTAFATTAFSVCGNTLCPSAASGDCILLGSMRVASLAVRSRRAGKGRTCKHATASQSPVM